MLINRNIVALFALPFMASATASELSIGAGAAYNESPYRGYNENTKVIPLISYEGDSFYVRQTTLGFILSQSEKNELSLTASWMPLEFDPADNDDYAMQQLDKRDSRCSFGTLFVLPVGLLYFQSGRNPEDLGRWLGESWRCVWGHLCGMALFQEDNQAECMVVVRPYHPFCGGALLLHSLRQLDELRDFRFPDGYALGLRVRPFP